MFESVTFSTFILASLILLLTPGPAVLYTVTRSIDQGRKAGLASVLGLGLGTLFQILGVACGLSALIATSAWAFHVLKFLGAAYLMYLGIRRILTKDGIDDVRVEEGPNVVRIFLQGILVDLLNPKTALFFLAYFPQFIDVSKGSSIGQILFLGSFFVALGLIVGSAYALLAGKIGKWLRSNGHFVKGHRFLSGSVYIGLGIAAALADARKS